MKDGGLVVMSAPANPFRCPPGPYERASLIAWYLKTKKPRSKLIVLDAKDAFSKQKLFQKAWAELYPGLLEWVPLSSGGKLVSVDPAALTLTTDFETYKADVANVIPPQRAGRIAELAGVADRSGWCPIDPVTFDSTLQPNIHVIGDAAIAGAMPKSAFAANAQAKVCAAAVAALLAGSRPQSPKLINTCYSLAAPEYGFSVAGVYQPADGKLADVEGAGGISPLDAPAATREEEALLADALVPHDHRRSLRLNGGSRMARRAASRSVAAAGASLAGDGAAQRPTRRPAFVPYEIVGDAIPASLTGAPATRRAAAPSSATARSGCACCAIPARSRSRVCRARWRRTCAVLGRVCRRGSFACGWSMRHAAQPGHDHAALLPD